MTAWVFEARHCSTWLNEIKKTKLDTNTEPQAGINKIAMGQYLAVPQARIEDQLLHLL
jgi:hypothetical protein